ncbi:MAG: lipoprotein-releasing ABC transporter permease subunit [Pseudomonadota bacterium]
MMIRPLELLLSLRYLRARTRSRFISFIALASTVGVGVGVAALITVISVMNGFSGELRDNLLAVSAHVTVRHPGAAPEQGWDPVLDTLEGSDGVGAVTAYVEGEGMLARGARLRGTRVEGVDPTAPAVRRQLEYALVAGDLARVTADSRAALIGSGLSALLGARVGERLNLLVPRVGPRGKVTPSFERITVAGIIEGGVQEIDSTRLVMHRADVAALLGRDPAHLDGVRVQLEDLMAAPRVAERWQARLPGGFTVTDWADEQASYFRAVATEKFMMSLILSLIVAVAAFNVVATLVMVVNDKRTDIAILRTMGLTPRSVTLVFFAQGCLIGLIGVLGGLALGLLITLNLETLVPAVEGVLRIKLIPTDVYYLNNIPTDVRVHEVALITLGAFALSALSTLYPARRAARTQPADALRYE